MVPFLGIGSLLGFVICLIILIISIIRKSNKVKYWGIGMGVCFLILIICLQIPDTTNNSRSTAANSNTQTEENNKSKEIKLLEEKYKPLLESNKIYNDMDDSERKTADDLISNWEKLEQEFKDSYQVQKDSISKSKNDYNAQLEAEEKAKEEEAAKVAYDTGITYDQLARTPDDYKGKKAKFTGKVIQVMEGDKETDLRIAVNGNYDTVLFVGYDPKIAATRILENDNVTVKGTSIGIYSYQSTLGGKISIPGMWIDQIEINT